MVKQGIKIFCRVKPTKAKTGLYEVDEDDNEEPTRLSFVVPRDQASGFINNKKEEYAFRFEKVFEQKTKQDEIFEYVARDVVDNALMGYNGTIFAYGQTGSGKTFTITGGAERFVDRGIIPRTLSYLYEQYAKNPEYVYTTHISYLELYNESGYDLLDPKHEAAKLEDLPKVTLMEDSDGNTQMKNIMTHQASNEEEALNWLFLGDTNRMIAETPMNQASTRSHCIFTIHVSVREAGSATLRRAKVHLVDLAGSERVAKTGVGGNLLKEAKYINLSLHFLEQVIVALSEKSRTHIPYRNSMMTAVLRDSLGGNCMTTMIATCSVEKKNIDESISTCRFAQRVALIKNDAVLNEELDPKLMIAKLKMEISELKNQLALTSGEQSTDELTQEEIDRLQERVAAYIEDPDPECRLNVGADMRKINECFRILKRHQEERSSRPDDTPPPSYTPDTSYMAGAEVKKLQSMVQQRDNEINILVNMLKKEKKRALDAIKQASVGGGGANPDTRHRPTNSRSASEEDTPHSRHHTTGSSQSQSSYGSRMGHSEEEEGESSLSHRPRSSRRILGDMTVGRQEAFEIFRRDYEHNVAIEDNKHQLKERYGAAKTYGQQVNDCRQNINKVKRQFEHRRMQLAMAGDVVAEEEDEVEANLRMHLEDEKTRYKDVFNNLRVMKTEIEHLQHLLERSRLQLQKDFEVWWAEQSASLQAAPSPHRPPSNPGKAWRTPPVSPIKGQHEEHPNNIHHSTSSSSHLHGNSHALIDPSSYQRKTTGSHHHHDQGHHEHRSDHQDDHHQRHHRPHSATHRNALLQGLSQNQQGLDFARRPPVPPVGKSNSADDRIRRGGGESGPGEAESGRQQRSNSQGNSSSLKLTGDKRADADIMAFIKARQGLLQQKGQAP
ncbi:kinesin-like protein KIF6 [Strongylocentrotus purpuratus]|uniref:Kinesin-like protein n=1 Tax=Strongylocentrotus purpuratus TaxID=7668 RepID=A0A7M7PSG2_STRPU|nr:kinesin-like protein KIF6 [Strongylocentrotus purpuratus]